MITETEIMIMMTGGELTMLTTTLQTDGMMLEIELETSEIKLEGPTETPEIM